jgi:hypothetical protein
MLDTISPSTDELTAQFIACLPPLAIGISKQSTASLAASP